MGPFHDLANNLSRRGEEETSSVVDVAAGYATRRQMGPRSRNEADEGAVEGV